MVSSIRGIEWSHHVETGGNFPYLSAMDTNWFKKEIEDNCLDMNCLQTIDNLELAFQLKQKRFYRGLKIAHWCCQHYKLNKKVQDTLNSICPNSIPSFQWLNGFCEVNQIKNMGNVWKMLEEDFVTLLQLQNFSLCTAKKFVKSLNVFYGI